MKNKFIIPVIAIVLAGSVYATSIYARDEGSGSSTIIQKLVQRFGLKESDVQVVFDEERAEHIKSQQTRFEEKLTQAVNEGKITEAQKQLITAKKAETITKHLENKENWQNTTREQMIEERNKEKQELDSWASQNGIDLQYLFGEVMSGAKVMRHGWYQK